MKRQKSQAKNIITAYLSKPSVRMMLLIFAISLSILDVIQVSAISTKGYDIGAYQQQIRELARENEELDFDIANHRSMKHISTRIQELSFVEADQIRYTAFANSNVALNK